MRAGRIRNKYEPHSFSLPNTTNTKTLSDPLRGRAEEILIFENKGE